MHEHIETFAHPVISPLVFEFFLKFVLAGICESAVHQAKQLQRIWRRH